MYLLDVNVVLAAHREDHTHHERVRPWFDGLMARREPFGMPAGVWVSFVRLATHRRVFAVPTPPREAFEFLRAVSAQPAYTPLVPGPRHLELFERLCHEAEASGDLVADAALAALALELGCTLASIDRDFARFPGLSWVIPGGDDLRADG